MNDSILKSIIYWTSVLNENLWTYFAIPFIIFLGIYFSFKTKFVQFRRFKHFLQLSIKKEQTNHDGVSPLQAMLTSLGGRVGGGNLAGVGVAIFMGGPGALFWMVVIAFIIMSVAIIEVNLSQLYKVKVDSKKSENEYIAGPPFYIEKGLKTNFKKIIAVIFSICIAIQMAAWNGLQASYLDAYFTQILNTNQIFNTLFIVIILGTIILGGASWIIKICEKIVPFMAGFYLLLASYVIIFNFLEIPSILSTIFLSAIGFEQFAGGLTGWALSSALRNGIRRGIYSNETTVGSMSTIGGISTVKHPTKQGFINAFGVFLDTVVLCTATGIIILTAFGDSLAEIVIQTKASGANDLGGLFIQKAFAHHFGIWSGYYLIVTFFAFASTSIIVNHIIGEINLRYLSNNLTNFYKLIGILVIFYGSFASVAGIVHIADTLMGVSVSINLITLFLLRNKGFDTISDYERQINNNPDRDPVYKNNSNYIDNAIWN